MKIDTRDTTINDLLKHFYFIPRFQRPYSWEKEQVEQFWNDSVNENPADYFIGSVVLYKAGEKYGVVDGQQRITTVVLMLAALRNAFKAAQLTEQASGIQAIIEKKDIDNQRQYILATESSYPYLQDKILSAGEPEVADELSKEEELLASMFGYIGERVEEALDNWPHPAPDPQIPKHEAILKKIRDSVLSIKLITVELDNEDDAYLIFETLNTRGKDLQVSQLVKTHLSRQLKAGNKDLDPLKHNWDKLQETFDTTSVDLDVDTFLHHFWLSRMKYVPSKKLYASFKQLVDDAAKAAATMNDLVSDAGIYRRVGEPSYGKWTNEEGNLRASLRALSATFRVRQPFPLILSLMRCYRDKQLSKKNVEGALWMIECFHFAFTALGSTSSSGGLSRMYASWAQKLFAAKTEAERQKVIGDIKKALKNRMPSEEDFVTKFNELRNSDEYTKQKKLVKYILARLDDHLAHSGVVVNYEQMTIEHIAAQNPAPGSTKVSPDHVAMIGNQLLCSKELQDKLKNRAFAEKKKILKDEMLKAAKEVVAASEWTEAAIVERTERLAKVAYRELWHF